MLNLDEFTKNVFEDIRDGVPIIDSNSSASMYPDNSLHDANRLVGNDPFRNSSLPFSTASAANSETMFVSEPTDVNEHPSWDTVVPQNFARSKSTQSTVACETSALKLYSRTKLLGAHSPLSAACSHLGPLGRGQCIRATADHHPQQEADGRRQFRRAIVQTLQDRRSGCSGKNPFTCLPATSIQ